MNHALKIGKLAFTWAVVGMTIAWSVGLSMLIQPLAAKAATCPTLVAGDRFKVVGTSPVYLLNANMQRLYFTNADAYHSWFSDYSGIVEIDSSCLAAYPQPSLPPYGVNWRPGSRLVKLQIVSDVYAVLPGNKLAKVGSESVAAALYGSDWNRKVVDVSDAYWPNYVGRASEITEAKPHDGQLIKVGSSGSVWYVKEGSKVPVDGAISADVRVVTQAVADAVPTGSGSVTAASVYSNASQGVAGSSVPPSVPPVVVGGGSLSVSVGTLPSGSYALKNAARVPFTKLVLTAGSSDVTIDSFKVKRVGAPAQDSDFSTVNLVDANGNLLNDTGKTFNSDSLAVFTEDIVVPANTSKTYTIVGDMASSVGSGNVPALQLDSVELLGGGSVSGLPAVGQPVTVNNNITPGTVTLAEGSRLNASTKELGSTDINLASLKVTVTTNDFQLSRVTFYNGGTASDGDFGKFSLKYNNNVISTGSMKNKYLSFDLSSCTSDCLILKSNSRNYDVYGDIINGSGRTMHLYVNRTVHVLALDKTNNVYVTPTNNAGDAAMVNTITVSTGKLAVSKTNDVATSDVPSNTTDVKLGSFNFKVTGEPVDIRTLTFRVVTTGSLAPSELTNLTLYDASGRALNGGKDVTGGTTPGYATTTDTFTLPVGDNILTVKAKIGNGATVTDGTTIQVSVDMNNTTNFEARGTTTGDTVTLGTYATPSSYVTGNLMTVRTSQLRVTTLSTPASTTYAGGSTDLVCANVQLDAQGSTEDIRITQFKVHDTPYGGAQTADLQNVRLFVDRDGDSNNGAGTQVALSNTQSGSTATVNTAEALVFNLSGADQFVVKAGKKLTVTVKCNLTGSALTGTHRIYTNVGGSSGDVTAVGVTSGNTVTPSADSAQGQGVSVGTSGGTVQVSIDASNVTSKIYNAGAQGVTLASFNLLATTTEDVDIQKVYFTQRVTGTNSAAFQDYDLLYLTDSNGTVLGSVRPTSTLPGITIDAQANGSHYLVRTSNTSGQVLYLKANLSSIGSQQNVTVGGHNLGFNIASTGNITAKGSQSGASTVVYFGNSAPNGNTHYMYKATPTVSVQPVSSATLANGTNELFRMNVTANGGDISLYKVAFDITTTTATVSALQFVDITDSPEVQLMSTSSASTDLAYQIKNVLFDPANNSQCPSGVCAKSQGGAERVIASGTTRTFVLRGTVSGVASGASISTRLIGDSNHIVQIGGAGLMGTAVNLDQNEVNSFLWSDRSAGNHSTSTADWTNGYLVSGVNAPSSTPAVLSK